MSTTVSPGGSSPVLSLAYRRNGQGEGRLPKALVLAGFVLVAVGCTPAPAAQVRMVGDPSASVSSSINDVPYRQALTVGSIMLCVTSSATATITNVSVHAPQGDIHIDAFALRPNPYYRNQPFEGQDFKPIAEIGNGFSPAAVQQVAGVCPQDVANDPASIQSKTSELAIQISWSSGDVAGGHGLDVTYSVGGQQQTALVPFGVWICAKTCPAQVGK